MKYQLLPLDPNLDPVDFDTQNILDLALLGPYDKDAGVVYFDGVACLEPRPDKTTMTHVRRLEAALLAMKAERDSLAAALARISGKTAAWQQYTAKNTDREYPWWNLGDIANAALRKVELIKEGESANT